MRCRDIADMEHLGKYSIIMQRILNVRKNWETGQGNM